jgi:hypothetical protein
VFLYFVAVALALSIGWGIRGNFGHEYGAMIPGALAAMAAALLSGREDWAKRIPLFGFFGALGWSFGGSISYMHVISYTHSGHSPSVIYGFACLFVIGFLWAAPGGAATSFVACFPRQRLDALMPAIIAVFIGWTLQDIAFAWLAYDDGDHRHEMPLYWYDTDWVGVLVALVSISILAAIRRRWDEGCSIVLYMALGWWIGFLLLVNVLGLHMTPPRGDSWSGILGMVGGLWFYLWRRGDRIPLWSSICAGIWGGFGFAFATLLKLIELKSGANTNWHSILEQTYGFINGLGIAYLMWKLRTRAPGIDESGGRAWIPKFATLSVLLGITYLNLAKNPEQWIKQKAIPSAMHSISADAWFAAAYILLLAAILWIIRVRPAFMPATSLGRGQLLFLVFLWWMVVGNFERALTGFTAQRLVTEGVIWLNAAILTCLIVRPLAAPILAAPNFNVVRLSALGVCVFLLTSVGSWAITRARYGDNFANHGSLHLRFPKNP